MDNGTAIEVMDAGHDALLELEFRGHADVAKDRTRQFGEEPLDEVQPGAVRRGEGELEASGRSGGKPSLGFFRYVCGMIVEDQFDRSPGRIGGVKEAEEFDELAAAMAVFDESMDLAGQQIDACQQTERAMALVLVIPGEGRMDAGFGRQVGSRRGDGLDAGLFIARDDRNPFALARLGTGFFQHFDFTIDAQNLGHFPFEVGVTVLKIVADLVRLDFLLTEDLAYRALDQMSQASMSCRRPPLRA